MAEPAKGKESAAYCPGCGEMVDTYATEKEGVVESRCAFCGLILESAIVTQDILEKDCVIIVDDSELIRVMLKDALIDHKIAKKVISCSNGGDFITRLTERFEARLPIELVILDIQMPVMSGINAAVAMRAIESGLKRENRRIPIIFFSVKKCDENLKKAMDFCKPAQYINKAVSDSKQEMFKRIRAVVSRLLK